MAGMVLREHVHRLAHLTHRVGNPQMLGELRRHGLRPARLTCNAMYSHYEGV